MSYADAFRERQAAIRESREALRAWTKTLHLPSGDRARRAAFLAFREAEVREREACAAYQVALDTSA